MTDNYNVPNRAQPLTIVASSPINKNWEEIQKALNQNYDLASQVVNKIDITEKGVEGGLATLDINSKLESSQLPEQAKGHVFEVSNVSEQLSLNAYSGDICVRKDLNKTFSLKVDDPSIFANWVEIASSNAGGDIGGNPPYQTTFNDSKWEENIETGKYYITYDDEEHGQGATQYLFVSTKNTIGQEIYCQYTVDEQGVVTLYSDSPFSGLITISNLQGNCKNMNFVPYCVNSGFYDQQPSLITYTPNSVNLVTSPSIVIVDGMNYVRNITVCNETFLEQNLEDGTYILFVDSSNIEGTVLNNITYLNYYEYLGLVYNLPTSGKEGQRCYVRFDKSYEYQNNNWVAKAFTPVGEMVIQGGLVITVHTYDYRQNGINVNAQSSTLDYLYGPQITGLNFQINDNLIITTGKCLGTDRIIQNNNPIVKDYTQPWEQGNGVGCIDPNTNYTEIEVSQVEKDGVTYYTSETGEQDEYVLEGTPIYSDVNLSIFVKNAGESEFIYTGEYELDQKLTTGWGYVYLISDNYIVDAMLSFASTPELPTGYRQYRRIGYFYRDNEIKKVRQINNRFYFLEPQQIDFNLNAEGSLLSLGFPDCESIILTCKLDTPQIITFNDDITLLEKYINVDTLEIPNTDLVLKSEGEGNIQIKVLGYVDRRLK